MLFKLTTYASFVARTSNSSFSYRPRPSASGSAPRATADMSSARAPKGRASPADREMRDVAAALDPQPLIDQIWYSPPITFDPDISAALRAAADRSGHHPVDITSGAGHDACYISGVAPTGMVFIPCEDGLSHNEAEAISADHAIAGAEVTLHAVLRLAT